MNNGKFSERPEGAAPLFNAESGRAAADKRWEAKRLARERALIGFVEAQIGSPVSLEDAINFAITTPQFQAALKGKTAAAKFVSQLLDILPQPAPVQHLLQDNRQVNYNVFKLSRERAVQYIEDQRSVGNEKLALLVEAQIYEEEGEGPFEILVPLEDE